MTDHLLLWHLKRDGPEQLSRFCGKHRTRQELTSASTDRVGHFYITYHFDNGSHVRAELKRGDVRGYTTADYFKVVSYALGAA